MCGFSAGKQIHQLHNSDYPLFVWKTFKKKPFKSKNEEPEQDPGPEPNQIHDTGLIKPERLESGRLQATLAPQHGLIQVRFV